MDIPAYCREIEAYLCQKNDGHLIRVVGPSFEVVSGWAAQGVPLKVAFRGIDRYFERYYAKGPRRRPVKIDFCEPDVLDVFDEWRRALGLTQSSAAGPQSPVEEHPSRMGSHQSLPGHLERALLKLSNARAKGTLPDSFDGLIDRVARELDAARSSARGLRGEARQALIARLDALDAALGEQARDALDPVSLDTLDREADAELASYRSTMAPEAFTRAKHAAVERLVRERLGLPTVRFT